MSDLISKITTSLLAGAGGLAIAAFIAVIGLTITPHEAAATPKWAGATGKPCGYCHTKPPALNAKGKAFKAKGHKL